MDLGGTLLPAGSNAIPWADGIEPPKNGLLRQERNESLQPRVKVSAVALIEMSFFIETILAAFFLLVAPWMLHLGAIRGAPFYPDNLFGNRRLQSFTLRWLRTIIFANGVLLSLAFLLWTFGTRLFWIPGILGIPGILFQIIVIVGTVYHDTIRN